MGLVSKTLIVAPFSKSVPLYRRALKQRGWEIDIITATETDSARGIGRILKEIRNYIDEGKEIIIARGTVANQVRKEFGINVVELEITDFDVLKVLKEYIGYPEPIAVVECETFTRKVERMARLWGMDMKVITTSTISDLYKYILQVAQSGYKVVISGAWGEYNRDILAPYGINYEMVGCSEESVIESVERAFQMYHFLHEEKCRKEILNTIINFSLSGLIAVDRDGIVTTFNTAAEKQLELKQGDVVGRPVDRVFPKINLGATLLSPVPVVNKIVHYGDHKLVVTNVPLFVDQEITGAVSTFQRLTDVEEGELKIRSQLVDKGLTAKHRFEEILGRSERIEEVIKMAESYSQIDSTLLITGETGTGKEVFAQSIHNSSPRKSKPFVVINCSALPRTLLESELFGYADGAFTGAKKGGKIGIFELAHQGTIFLDEIGDIDKGTQASLLRVLQEKEVRRIGDDKVIPIDVRVISATNKDLYEEVLKGHFRDDLYFRLSVLNLHLPPLRERREDISLLVETFLNELNHKLKCKVTSLDQAIIDALVRYDWPGNVRELQNTLEKIVALTREGGVRYSQVVPIMDELAYRKKKRGHEQPLGITLEELEKKSIMVALKEENGNKSHAASRLGIDRSTLHRKLKKYQID